MSRLFGLIAAALLCTVALPAAPTARATEPPVAPAAMVPASELPNGGFEQPALIDPGRPNFWSGHPISTGPAFGWDDRVSLQGRRSASITVAGGGEGEWVNTVQVAPNTVYVLSGWVKTLGVVPDAPDSGATIGLQAGVRSAPVTGDSGWTYLHLVFRTPPMAKAAIITAFLEHRGPAGSTGTAWFDGLRLTRVTDETPIPQWKVQVLIYRHTDFTYTDGGVSHRYVGRLSDAQVEEAAHRATTFVTEDIPALNSHVMTPTLRIDYPERALNTMERFYQDGGVKFWPGPADTAAERDPNFDSVIVIWQADTVDQTTGQPAWIGAAGGMAYWNPAQLYSSLIIEGTTTVPHRNFYRHEWGHSLVFHFEGAGTAPQPMVDNHEPDSYVNCHTGAAYLRVPEDGEPAPPNSIYANDSGFTHDYYSGAVALASDPSRCIGVDRKAWSAGGPVSKPGYFPYYYNPALGPVASTREDEPGSVVTHTLTLSNGGNASDHIALGLAGQDERWALGSSLLDPKSVAPGESVELKVAVGIPADAAAGEEHTFTLTATSSLDPSQVVTATLTTRAAQPPDPPQPAPRLRIWLPLVLG